MKKKIILGINCIKTFSTKKKKKTIIRVSFIKTYRWLTLSNEIIDHFSAVITACATILSYMAASISRYIAKTCNCLVLDKNKT